MFHVTPARYHQVRDESRLTWPVIAAACLAGMIWIALDIARRLNFLRDPLSARLSDAIVPVGLVAAWLVGRVLRLTAWMLRLPALAAATAVAAVGAMSIDAVGHTREQLQRTNVRVAGVSLTQLFRGKTAELSARYAGAQLPNEQFVMFRTFFAYLDRCTTTRHRLLVGGNAPEIYVYAQRPFAAGHSVFIEGYFQSKDDQQRMMDRLRQQVVAFVIFLGDQYADWRASFARLNTFVEANFRPLVDVRLDAERKAFVLVRAGLPQRHMDETTGWPCFR